MKSGSEGSRRGETPAQWGQNKKEKDHKEKNERRE
jgi:hypothetical protein